VHSLHTLSQGKEVMGGVVHAQVAKVNKQWDGDVCSVKVNK